LSEIILWVAAIVKICEGGFNPEGNFGDGRARRAEDIKRKGLVPNFLFDDLIVNGEMNFGDNLFFSLAAKAESH